MSAATSGPLAAMTITAFVWAVPLSVPTDAAGQDGGQKTVWDGVVGADQVARGQKAYLASCGACHKEDMLGDNTTPPLVGPEFFDRWVGSSVDDVVQTIRRSMPQSAPDSLSQQVYVDIIARLLNANGSPTGAAELPADRAALKQIFVTRAGGR